MNALLRWVKCLPVLAAAALLAGCERPPVDSVQTGYRGTGMLQVYNPRTVAEQIPLNQPPAAIDAGAAEGPKAKDVYQNVKVLGDLSVGQFTAQMVAITAWVSPVEGCNYCHNAANLADDSKYQKVVARRMIQMTQHVNADWKTHVAATGVTCYTCHRGNPVPTQTYYQPLAQDKGANFMGNRNGQNTAAKDVGLMSLPADPVTPYLLNTSAIRVGGTSALPTGNKTSIQATEGTYSLMVHMSTSLGVNCTYCHNSRAFGNWAESSPKRTVAWHGIRMAGDINRAYLDPLGSTLPANRKGPNGDTPLVSCATCHQGAYKPVYGAAMAKDWPGLQGLQGASAAPAVATLPPPLMEAGRSVLYFDVGSPVLQGPQAAGLAALVDALKTKPAARATVSGYHSAAGTLAQNQELAKQRAFNVRDSLLAAGIPAARVQLDKPQQTGANVAGEDPTSRRVEVTVK
jgi:photosynthetic reaction center cytochrome c subunit